MPYTELHEPPSLWSRDGQSYPPKRRWCLVIVVNVLVIVCLLEIGLRLLIGNALPPRFFEPSEKFGHLTRRGINSPRRLSPII